MRSFTRFALCMWLLSCWFVVGGQGQESSPEALDVYSDAASFQNNGEFKLAAEEWDKFLAKYSKDPLANKARHYAGVCHMQIKNYEAAVKHFSAALAADPKFELAEDALLNLGWCQYTVASGNREKLAESIATYRKLVAQFPEGKFVDQALFQLGEAFYHSDQKPEAATAYSRLVEKHPNSKLRPDAAYALGVTLDELQTYDKAGAAYAAFLQDYAEHPLANEVRMRKAETMLQTGDAAGAEAEFAAVAVIPDFALADYALYRQAKAVSAQNKVAAAGELYARLVEKYPDSKHKANAAVAAGRCFYVAERLDDAAKWFQVGRDGQSEDAVEAVHWLCKIHLTRGQPDKALALIDQTLPAAEGHAFRVALLLDQADAWDAQPATRAQGRDAYRAIAKSSPDHELAPQAQYNAAFSSLELGEYDAADQDVARFLERYRQHLLAADAEFVRAESRFRAGQDQQAEAAFAQLIENHGEHAQAAVWRLRRALAQQRQKKFDAVVADLTESLDKFTAADQQAEARYLIGQALFQQRKFAEAAASLAAARAAADRWRLAADTLILLARSQAGAGDGKAARETIAQVADAYPDSPALPSASYYLGEFCYAAGDFAAAVAAYDQLLAKWPKDQLAPSAWYGKGWARIKSGDFEQGEAAFTELIERHPQHEHAARARLARAICRRNQDRFADAIADVEAFLKAEPRGEQTSAALHERGLAEVGLKQFAAAAATFEAILKQDPTYAKAAAIWYELAWARQENKQADAALEAFRKLAEAFPTSEYAAEAHFLIGESHYDAKQYEPAQAAYAAAKEKAVSDKVAEQALYGLGRTYFQLQQFDQAAAEFAEQTRRFPEGALAANGLFMAGESCFKQGDYAAASKALTAARARPAPTEAIAALTLLRGAQTLAQLKQWSESNEWATALLTDASQSAYAAEAFYERGWARQNLNQLDDALQDYEQAAALSRNAISARARFMIGEVYFQKKDFETAIRSFKRVMFGYGDDQASAEVKPWQAEAAYEAGRCAEVQIKDENDSTKRTERVAEARSSYEYVIKRHPEHERATLAKQRLAALPKR